MNWLQRTGAAIASAFRPAAPVAETKAARGGGYLTAVDDRGWWTAFTDLFGTGSWQQDITIDHDTVAANWAVFACATLIASDVGKVDLCLVEETDQGTWKEADGSPLGKVLCKPNKWQTRQQFIESWLLSMMLYGNAYILKERDNRGVVVGLYVLHPIRVRPLVAEFTGEVFYQLQIDLLSGISEEIPAAPASEIIHDRMNCLFHPLVGLSPIFASGLAAMQGIEIQKNSAKFFKNMSRPSGLLTAPGTIADDTAKRLKANWEENYGGKNMGRVAVLGDGLNYQAIGISPDDAQMTELLKSSADTICATFHVPAFKIGAGTIPAGQKVEDLNQIYYADCLQARMVAIETLLAEGIGLDGPINGREMAVKFDLDDLLKMDTATFINTIKLAVDGSLMSPNEGRAKLNLPPVKGGESPLSQQQNYSLAALAKRDAQDNPFAPAGAATPPPAAQPAPAEPPAAEPADAELVDEEMAYQAEALAAFALRKYLRAA